MKKRRERKTFTQKEIGVALNNAVALASASSATVGQTDERRRRIRAYTEELSNILLADVDEGYMKAEELVQILAASSLFVQCVRVLKTARLPQFEHFAASVLEDERT